ncbi:slowmo family protein [Tieghemostelium lacteum]|uniref:Slowmo family protein n=1 Tax=Tieghemostelium lacteum TaxID=361077 RepID=A0A151Z725_TIELA|nr:slowmo family protein [Tieghemostelium lacteum]|eukprot:KYQ89771.1 slowmo family protein [Tieghemostelium lacteum]
MPLFETITHTYKHLWSDVSTGSWRKYPSPNRPDILSIDMLTKEFDPETGVLKCTKLIICKGNTPSWLQAVMGNTECFFFEETIVDPQNKKMVLTTKNLNFTNILGVEEVCTYTPHPENNEWTLFTQEAKVTSSLFGIARKMEAFCLEKFKANAHKGRKIMEDAIQKVKLEAEESLANLEATLDTLKQEVDESIQAVVFQTTKLEDQESQSNNQSKISYNNILATKLFEEEEYTKNNTKPTDTHQQQQYIFLNTLLSDTQNVLFDFDIPLLSNINTNKYHIE